MFLGFSKRVGGGFRVGAYQHVRTGDVKPSTLFAALKATGFAFAFVVWVVLCASLFGDPTRAVWAFAFPGGLVVFVVVFFRAMWRNVSAEKESSHVAG